MFKKTLRTIKNGKPLYTKTNRLTPVSKWICCDCGTDCFIDDRDFYMLQHDLWAKYGVGEGMLCMNCIEDRLGHPLTKDDILPCHVTEHFNPYTREILKK